MFVLGPNQLQRFYQGGAEIASFRGLGAAADGPEDWVASVTTAFGEQRAGLSSLPDGRMLADAIAESPEWFLSRRARRGLRHRYRPAGQAARRLPSGCPCTATPTRPTAGPTWAARTARRKPGSCSPPAPKTPVSTWASATTSRLAYWLAGWPARTCPRWSARCTGYRSAPGTACWCLRVPPHAIGPGVFLAELQEPTDLSILLEWHGFLDDGTEAGSCGWATPLCWPPWTAPGGARAGGPGCACGAGSPGTGGGITRLLPSVADPFFRLNGCSRKDTWRCLAVTRLGSPRPALGPWPPSTAARCRCAAA